MIPITVHHLEKSRSHRVLWLLEELGLEYDLVEYKRHPRTSRAPAALRKIHPLGRSPVVVLKDGEALAESGAIIEEVLDRFGEGRLRPEPRTEAHRRYRFWLHYAEGSLMPTLLVKLITSKMRTDAPLLAKPVSMSVAALVDRAYTDPEIRNHLSFVEESLRESRWLAGEEFSAADIQMSFPLFGAQPFGVRGRPKIRAFLEEIESRPAFQRARERGGPVVP
ncbi:MAG: glutathione S-transferase N-terminal domain-containing protein [Myxococcota bacterium]